MIKVQYIQECVCGAITVTFDNNVSNSMSYETFKKLRITGKHLPQKFCCCNHCVNHWGIDICKCGSGLPVGQCECGSDEPSEELGMNRQFVGWAS